MSTEVGGKSKKILILSIAWMMFFTIFTTLPLMEIGVVYGVGETAEVTGDTVNVRSGPGTSYKKIGTLKKGKTFVVKGMKKSKSGVKWYKLEYKAKTGYISSKYVNIKKVTVKSVSDLKGTVKTGGSTLNIRSGPGSSYKKLGSYENGKVFTITGKAKDINGVWWYRLTYKKADAFVSSEYVKTSVIKDDDKGTEEDKQPSDKPAEDKPEDNDNNTAAAVTNRLGVTTADGGLNVRSGAGTGYNRLTMLPKGSTVVIKGSEADANGKKWYKYKFSSTQVGYICSDYVNVKTVTSDAAFEEYLTAQGFPNNYKPYLRALHAQYPEWQFQAVKVGYSWEHALSAESVIGRNLVSPSSPLSYRSTEPGAYNSKTGVWTKFDGSWYAANQTVIAYYMDPRNFLTEDGIYQFMTHTYDRKSQKAKTVAAVIKGSFMETADPGEEYSSYAELINAAGKEAGVNPNVLAAMIIQEQGWSGSSLVSGTYKGYKGYYNFFNVGAYTTSTMSAVQRGLWYAKGSGTGATSYSRPWDSPYKSIKGGAEFYSEGYVSNNQDSYYSKKFNVYNGADKVGTHQYMTFVAAAASEGSLVRRAYVDNTEYPVVFEIPVFNSMPSTNCQLPL